MTSKRGTERLELEGEVEAEGLESKCDCLALHVLLMCVNNVTKLDRRDREKATKIVNLNA